MTGIEVPEEAIARNFHAIAARDCVFRCHQVGISGIAFNPGQGQPTRFSPLFSPKGESIPTLYAAESFDAAVYETIFRQEASHLFSVSSDIANTVAVSRITVCRELLMVPLFTPELRRWNIEESELFSPCESIYKAARALATAIWRDNPRANGIKWCSRQDSTSNAYLLFGDRCNDGDLLVQQTQSVDSDEDFPQQLVEVAQRAGIDIA